LREFETRILSDVARHVAHIDPSETFVDDVRQALRERLLLPEGERPPRLAAYRGDGPLGAWVRAAAIRTALNMRRRRAQETLDADTDVAPGDPELDYVRATYAQQFRAALEVVLVSLDAEDRDILRLYYLEQRNIAEIGASVGAHRSTIARRLNRLREGVLQKTCDELRERLRLEGHELDALLSFARDDVDVSVRRILVASK
jgi:RNA polymerase sigma-70 factor (ECF subfamily)